MACRAARAGANPATPELIASIRRGLVDVLLKYPDGFPMGRTSPVEFSPRSIPEGAKWPSAMPHMSSIDEFGANDWLIEEIRERYRQDPGSVDQSWVDYFTNHPLGGTSAPATGGTSEAATAGRSQAVGTAMSQPGTTGKVARHDPTDSTRPTVEPLENRRETPSHPGTSGGLGPQIPNPFDRPRPPMAEANQDYEIGRASCRKECRSRWSPYH